MTDRDNKGRFLRAGKRDERGRFVKAEEAAWQTIGAEMRRVLHIDRGIDPKTFVIPRKPLHLRIGDWLRGGK